MIFRLANRVFGIELSSIREILSARRITRLPGAPPTVLGLINVRGTIVTVIDLGARLTGESARAGGSVILVDHGTRAVGMAVDEVIDVQRLDDSSLGEDLDVVVSGGAVRALGRHEGHAVALLDPQDIISHVLA